MTEKDIKENSNTGEAGERWFEEKGTLPVQKEITTEERNTVASLVKNCMKITNSRKAESSSAGKTAWVMTSKFKGRSFRGSTLDVNGDRFYVRIHDSRAGKEFPSGDGGLNVEYIKTSADGQIVGYDSLDNLPRDPELVMDAPLTDLSNSGTNWEEISELDADLAASWRVYREAVYTEKASYQRMNNKRQGIRKNL